MNEYLVSIIVPAYNCENTIAETIESVLQQTWSNWEMIVVDDCSTDNTRQIVEQYSEKNDRVRLIRHKTNSGSAASRNTAISHANGRFIALLDSDDLWKPCKLEKQIAYMIDNDLPFTYTAYETFSKEKRKRTVIQVPGSVTYYQYLKNTIIGCLTVVIDKEKISDFHMEPGYLEDVLTWMHYLKKGFIAYGINENLAEYRVITGSKSNNKFKNSKRYYECLKVQKLNLMQRLYYEVCYMFNATRKRIFGKKYVPETDRS